jgi:hypothetical protein
VCDLDRDLSESVQNAEENDRIGSLDDDFEIETSMQMRQAS